MRVAPVNDQLIDSPSLRCVLFFYPQKINPSKGGSPRREAEAQFLETLLRITELSVRSQGSLLAPTLDEDAFYRERRSRCLFVRLLIRIRLVSVCS